MKRVTASEARRDWFRLLDEVLDGAVIAIVRKGKRTIIRRKDPKRAGRDAVPNYRAILSVPDAEQADSWTWDGPGADGEITPARRKP